MASINKASILFIFILLGIELQAQNYELKFTGSGASDSIDSISIENLTQGTSLSIEGSDILLLMNLVTGIDQPNRTNTGDLSIFPNPSWDFSNIKFESTEHGHVIIEILDISGRVVAMSNTVLPPGIHTFQAEGLSNGIYLVNVITARNSISGRLVSTISHQQEPALRYNNSRSAVSSTMASPKKSGMEVMMQYNTGDLLKINCKSGNFKTVIMDSPAEDKTLTSIFLACTDHDNNNYPVVQIGNQTWMAENLRTTHYSDGSELQEAGDSLTWINSITGSYSFYKDSVLYGIDYGALYNLKSVKDLKNLCPEGWHIPTDADWAILQESLGGRREAGVKLKETGAQFWNGVNPNADNSSGFSGRPAGHRINTGSFTGMGNEAGWWTSTSGNGDSAWIFSVDYNSSRLNRNVVHELSGYSVRCISGIPGLPVVITNSVYPVELSTATTGGTITTDGGSSVTERGVCWGIEANPTIDGNHTSDSTGVGSFISHLTGLTPGAAYHVRAYATNALGTTYGADSFFTTNLEAMVPIIETGVVSVNNSSSAIAGGNVVSNGGDEITARGICWSRLSNPTADLETKTVESSGSGSFKSQINGLSPGVIYHIRAYASNGVGTAYGKETSFSIIMNESGPQVADIDGNVYNTVYIGNQLWMAENLKTKHYRDGTVIPSAPLTSQQWLGLTTGALCYYDNDELNNKNVYGPLYNWYAVIDERILCPTGWHVPSNEEIVEFRDYLGGLSIAGAKMKETESGLWRFPNTGADNSSGFTALPGGDRDKGAFGSIHDGTGWWSTTEVDQKNAWSHYLYYSSTSFFPSPDEKVSGCSVRCMKD